MAKFFASFHFHLVLLSLCSVCILDSAGEGNNQGELKYCVAKPSTSDEALLENIDYVCREQGIKGCETFQKDSNPCYSPNTPVNHASQAMNLYYQAKGRHDFNCDFKDTGLITITPPSYGGCYYAYNQTA
ncbi:Carbohydrate-binding X8 domain superfamily protein [Striga hermonthica]|uniref:Carbohydrate-binding X8 domain superfamily protein n=1 Tax=Striga hermonthica TaxID=68872 RepID=A0A9N7R7D5_STRHE|nr:Carbohydrate-binding X8 domain superfamily protein [Striga hermonthica]